MSFFQKPKGSPSSTLQFIRRVPWCCHVSLKWFSDASMGQWPASTYCASHVLGNFYLRSGRSNVRLQGGRLCSRSSVWAVLMGSVRVGTAGTPGEGALAGPQAKVLELHLVDLEASRWTKRKAGSSKMSVSQYSFQSHRTCTPTSSNGFYLQALPVCPVISFTASHHPVRRPFAAPVGRGEDRDKEHISYVKELTQNFSVNELHSQGSESHPS